MMALREIPFGRIRHSPRYLDLTLEEAFDRAREAWIVQYERHGVPIRDILAGRLRLTRFRQSGQLQLVITIMSVFIEAKENSTHRGDHYEKMEKSFARNLFNVLVSVKRDIDWSVGRNPPIDRDSCETLKKCYDFEPFRNYWSRRKKRRARGYMDTIKFYYDTVNLDRQEEMRHQILRNDELMYTEDLA